MFKDPIKSKIGTEKKKNPWDFTAPCYDQRNMISAGDNYGVGFNQPVGRKGNPTKDVPTLPRGRVDTMKVDNIPIEKLDMYGKKKIY